MESFLDRDTETSYSKLSPNAIHSFRKKRVIYRLLRLRRSTSCRSFFSSHFIWEIKLHQLSKFLLVTCDHGVYPSENMDMHWAFVFLLSMWNLLQMGSLKTRLVLKSRTF